MEDADKRTMETLRNGKRFITGDPEYKAERQKRRQEAEERRARAATTGLAASITAATENLTTRMNEAANRMAESSAVKAEERAKRVALADEIRKEEAAKRAEEKQRRKEEAARNAEMRTPGYVYFGDGKTQSANSDKNNNKTRKGASVMGILSGQFANVVEWQENRDDMMFWKWKNNEIKKGSKLIIRKGQDAIFMYNGKVEGIFADEGSFDIESQIVPFLSTLKGFKFGFNSGIRCEVLFINTKEFTVSWGTKSPITLQAEGLPGGLPIGAFGTFTCKLGDYDAFIDKIAGIKDQYRIDEIRERVLSMVSPLLMKWISKEGKDMFNLQMAAVEIGNGIKTDLDMETSKMGINITGFYIESFNYPESVEKMRQKAAAQGMMGDVGKYTQMAMADGMANGNSTASSMASQMAGMQMGMMMGSNMANQMANNINNAGNSYGNGSAYGNGNNAGAYGNGNNAGAYGNNNTVNTNNGGGVEAASNAPKFCPNCGTPTNGAKFCSNCGNKLC